MLAVGQDASGVLLEAEHEFLIRSVVPAADASGTDEISLTDLDLPPLESRAAIRIAGSQLGSQPQVCENLR